MTPEQFNDIALGVMKLTGCKAAAVIMFQERADGNGHRADICCAVPDTLKAEIPAILRGMADQIENNEGEVVLSQLPEPKEDSMAG